MLNTCPYCDTENKVLLRLLTTDGTSLGAHQKVIWQQNNSRKQVVADPSICINCGGLFIRQEKLEEINRLLEE